MFKFIKNMQTYSCNFDQNKNRVVKYILFIAFLSHTLLQNDIFTIKEMNT